MSQTPHLKALTSEWILDLKCLFILYLALALTGSSISREQSGHWNLNLPPLDSISIGSTYKQINLFQYQQEKKSWNWFHRKNKISRFYRYILLVKTIIIENIFLNIKINHFLCILLTWVVIASFRLKLAWHMGQICGRSPVCLARICLFIL